MLHTVLIIHFMLHTSFCPNDTLRTVLYNICCLEHFQMFWLYILYCLRHFILFCAFHAVLCTLYLAHVTLSWSDTSYCPVYSTWNCPDCTLDIRLMVHNTMPCPDSCPTVHFTLSLSYFSLCPYSTLHTVLNHVLGVQFALSWFLSWVYTSHSPDSCPECTLHTLQTPVLDVPLTLSCM